MTKGRTTLSSSKKLEEENDVQSIKRVKGDQIYIMAHSMCYYFWLPITPSTKLHFGKKMETDLKHLSR